MLFFISVKIVVKLLALHSYRKPAQINFVNLYWLSFFVRHLAQIRDLSATISFSECIPVSVQS